MAGSVDYRNVRFLPVRRGDPRRLGRWRVKGRLGQGGMGVVYLATDGRQMAAVKTVHPQLLDEPGFRDRFEREARVAQRVDSPRVARLLDVGLEQEPAHLAFAYVDGRTLAAHVGESGPLSEIAVIGFAAALADALVAVHDAGVTHRDIKPTNVICAETGPVVIDFGVALVAEATTSLTSTGVVVGSAGWMSPEQVAGHEVGPATDVFAWASTINFAASGQGPFGSGRADAIAYRIRHDEPSLAGLPDPLGQLVAQALAKEPNERPTARSIRDQLLDSDTLATAEDPATRLIDETWLGTTEPSSRHQVSRLRRSWIVATAAAACAIAVLIAAVALSRQDDNAEAGVPDPTATSAVVPSTSTAPPPATTATPTSSEVTVPGPPAPPHATWAASPVVPPPDLQPALDVLSGTDQQTGPFGCPVYAPVSMAHTGMSPGAFPQYTRIGTFQFGWESESASAYINIHVPDSQNVQPYFDADPDGLVYDDGSVRRTISSDEFLVTIPGSPCYYEISLHDVPMAYRQTVLDLKPIQLSP